MKSTLLVMGIVGILAILGIAGYAVMTKEEASPVAIEETPVVVDTPNEARSVSSGRYVEYSSANLAEAASNRRVLFFYANWCPTCKPADESFATNENRIPGDVTVIRVNYNDNQTDEAEKELAKKYNITYQHTYVQIDAQGNQVAIWNGGGIDELLSNLK